jgi:hypothetical protein
LRHGILRGRRHVAQKQSDENERRNVRDRLREPDNVHIGRDYNMGCDVVPD